MSIHKLTAGSGYDYLTRQVAAQDVTERGHAGLAAYYAAKGEAPGVWVGAGMAGLEGLRVGDPVTEEQMRNLFGSGRHPLAEQLRATAAEGGMDIAAQDRATWLGRLYPVYENDIPEFRRRVAEQVAAVNAAHGRPVDAALDLEERARIRTQVATQLFQEEFGRAPADPREMSATIARHSRPRTTAVAGYDLTFSPVKSVSTLWAVADRPVAALIEQAHQQAVADALTYLETTALYTREGAQGVRQVETRGLIATAFTHRDSRAGDPDLHTHVAVANKVQTRTSGAWLAIDGRLLFKATVAASETYNTRLEHHLKTMLGVQFTERAQPDPKKRPVREIVGVDPALNELWSARRHSIESRRAVLATQFQAAHGRPPTPVESIHLAQQATLETRDAKHAPRSPYEQRTTWAAQAADLLGSPQAVTAMVTTALSPTPRAGDKVDAAWVSRTAAGIVTTLQGNRSHWQRWHVEAEALRQVRRVDLPTADLDRVVSLLVDEALSTHSVLLARPTHDPLAGAATGRLPAALRRSDGASVYTVAGSTLFTSRALLEAEARVVDRAGQVDGWTVSSAAVDAAMTSSAAEGVALNAGQALLVREMATSGARVQLAIAPAGAGKTTAMRALAQAWTTSGDVVGLAPSAAAAAVLGESLGTPTDTMAKLIWHLHHPHQPSPVQPGQPAAKAGQELPAWAQRIGPQTLVVVDEAGMADTLSLDAVVEFVVARGGSVRLIGDDQQLAAVGAGGVLRDIQATHGCLHLSELMRFTHTGEGPASLALREGLPEAWGFYLDHDRVHVGDLTTATDDLFTAWATDHENGHDALMLAPTRDLVRDLNHRARHHRLHETDRPAGAAPDGATVTLSDGNLASVGDTVLTRSNDRTLRLTATDWVKNGDRWHITALHPDGALNVRHTRTHLHAHLPAAYVAASVELGYACTIHTAQGVTADTSHTLLTGDEPRQVTYTALTRGRSSNHVYLQVVGDGNEHDVIHPDHTHPPTATDLLEQILTRDGSSRSAHTLRRDSLDPITLLHQAAARYLDSVHAGAEHLLGPEQLTQLDHGAERVVPGVTHAPAWPTLRAHLVLLAAHGRDPLEQLEDAAGQRELGTAVDVSAVLDWRLPPLTSLGVGPLPWLPAVPARLDHDPHWGPYLTARAAVVRDLREQVATATVRAAQDGVLPGWARQGLARPADDVLADIAVWRAATGVAVDDQRPTGPSQVTKTLHQAQQHLLTRLTRNQTPALDEWSPTFTRLFTSPRPDPFLPVLAERLAGISRAGLDAPALIRRAMGQGSLPDDHQAGALWWRLAAHLSPAVAIPPEHSQRLTTSRSDRLPDLIGEARTAQLQQSPWWPALVTAIDHAIARGTNLTTLITGDSPHQPGSSLVDETAPIDDIDPCLALAWHISVLSDPPPTEEDRDRWPELDPAPSDLAAVLHSGPEDAHPRLWAPTAAEWTDLTPLHPQTPPGDDDPTIDVDDATGLEPGPVMDDEEVAAILLWASRAWEFATVLPPSDREIETQLARAYEAETAQVSPERILQLNQLALDFYTAAFPGSWAQKYLTDRMRTDLTGDPRALPGYAPAGWTTLVDHLRRRHGVTDLELVQSGLASTTRQGRVIDWFRDRLVFPITRTSTTGDLEPLGFVGRRHPDHPDRDRSPKYLNTPDTALFHKGAQLYIVGHNLLRAGATPVLVEGPLDALAVTTAGHGRYVGVTPLGTALTEEQAAQLARLAHHHHHNNDRHLVVATDADHAGHVAAERDYWLLTQHHLYPSTVALRPGSDPADVLAQQGRDALRGVLTDETSLTSTLLDAHLTDPAGPLLHRAIALVAAGSPAEWEIGVHRLADATNVAVAVLRRELAAAVRDRDSDPRQVTSEHLNDPARQLSVTPSRTTTDVLPAPATRTPTLPNHNAHRPTPVTR